MISVIITTCKREQKILHRSMQSVIKQTYTDWELIVIDDSPDDWLQRTEIERMVSELKKSNSDKNIVYQKNENNQGACRSRNTGLSIAKGEYIAFLDDDDEWVEQKLEKQINKFINADENLALVYCGSYYFDDDSGKKKRHKDIFIKEDVFSKLISNNFIGGCSFPLMRTRLLKNIGGFDVKMAASQDLDVWLRLCEKYNVDYVDEPLVIYHRYGGEQISGSPEKKISGQERLINKNIDFLRKNKREYNRCILNLASYYAVGGHFLISIKKWISAITLSPISIYDNILGLLRIIKWSLIQKNKRA
jgi:Glycosyltransferases, probably involved in cell wall biogenesis